MNDDLYVERLAIVGSSVLTTAQSHWAKWLIEAILCELSPTYLISGGAQGIDTIAATAFRDLTEEEPIEYLPEHPSWNGNGDLFGFKHRNMRIVEDCEALIRVAAKNSDTYGSGWTADRAEELGKPVRRIWI